MGTFLGKGIDFVHGLFGPVGWITNICIFEPLGYSDSFCWGKPAKFGGTRVPQIHPICAIFTGKRLPGRSAIRRDESA